MFDIDALEVVGRERIPGESRLRIGSHLPHVHNTVLRVFWIETGSIR